MPPETSLMRPTVLTEEVLKQIGRLLCEGNYLSTSCQAAGISYQIFCHWRKRWREGDPAAARHHEFFEAIELASAQAETEALRRVRSGKNNWQSEAWFLERRFPKRWGRKDRAPVPPPEPPRPIGEMSREEVDAFEQVLAAADRARP